MKKKPTWGKIEPSSGTGDRRIMKKRG